VAPHVERSPARRSAARHWTLLGAKVLVSGGLLYLLFRQTDLSTVLQRLHNVDLRWMLAALAIYGLMVGISAWRWRVLLRTQHVDCPLSHLGSSFLVATFFNNFLPSNIGGDVIRIADTVSYTSSRTLATGVVLVDRALGLLALVLVAAIGSWRAQHSGLAMPGTQYLWVALVAGSLAAVPTLLMPKLLDRLLTPIYAIAGEWARARLSRLTGMLGRINDHPGALGIAFAGALAVQLVLVGFYLAVAHGLQIPLSVASALLVVPVSLVLQMVPVSINGFGVREAVFTFYFQRLGLGVDAALALSLISTATIAFFSLSGGVLFLLRRGGLTPATVPSDTSE